MENRKFGIEIEAFGVDKNLLAGKLNEAGINTQVEGYNHDSRPHWKIVSDGSIQGERPFELVSPPLIGQAGLDEIKTVCRVLNELGAQVNKSCGLHVHHDANDYSLDNFKRLYTLYHRFESTLDTFQPESRRANNNTYCKGFSPAQLAQVQAARNLEEIKSIFSRYQKLNIHSYWRHGTIEVRHAAGTVNADKIINWVLLTQLMVERAKSSVKVNSNRAEVNLKQLQKVLTRHLEEIPAQVFKFFRKRQAQLTQAA